MVTEKEFNSYNFYEKVEKFEQYAAGLKDIPKDLLEEALKFFDLLKRADLRRYTKIDSNKYIIFISKKDFGLEIFHSEEPERRILFHFDNYETPLIFKYDSDKYYDCMFGQGIEETHAYLLKNLENIKKITRRGKYIVEDTFIDNKGNIVYTIKHQHIFNLFHIKRMLNLLPAKSEKVIIWK